MKKALSLLLALVMIVTCLAGISFAAEPLFEVTNGDDVQTVDTVEAMLALINANGNTKVKLLRSYHHDVSTSNMGDDIAPAYSCELDLNGFVLSTDDGNAWSPKAAGTENVVSVVKNGTLWTTDPRLAGQSAIRVYGGALRVENVVAYAPNGMTVATYVTDPQYNEENLITGCILVSGNYLAKKGETTPINCGWAPYGFNKNDGTQSKMYCKIENSTLLTVKPTGSNSLDYRTAGNTVELGKNVNIFSWYTQVAKTGITMTGETLKADTEVYTIDVPAGIPAKGTDSADITEYVGLKRWYTEPFATVETKGTVVNVANLAEMVAAIDKKGESVVTLYEDITHNATINLPTCTLDLNGHTVTVKDSAGEWLNAVYFADASTDDDATNLYSVLKNGTIHGKAALSCNVGALRVTNATICSYNGTAIQLTDGGSAHSFAKGLANDGNVIENSTLYSKNYTALIYNSTGKDFGAATVTVKDSDLVTEGASSVLLSCHNKVSKSGNFVLGTGVNFYYLEGGVARTAAPAPALSGAAVSKVDGTWAVEVAGTAYEGFNRSTTETKTTPTATAENGTVTLSPAAAYSGETVTVTATPAEGYELDYIEVNGEAIEGTSFVMPKTGASVKAFFKVKAVEEPEATVVRPTNHGIKIEAAEGGTVTASVEKATINTIVKLNVQAAEGYVLESISVKKLYNGTYAKVAEDNSFYMPYSNVVITPVFKKA